MSNEEFKKDEERIEVFTPQSSTIKSKIIEYLLRKKRPVADDLVEKSEDADVDWGN